MMVIFKANNATSYTKDRKGFKIKYAAGMCFSVISSLFDLHLNFCANKVLKRAELY